MERITVSNIIDAPIGTVWECYTDPERIKAWNRASPDWHTPRVENDVRAGGTFDFRMEAKDGSAGFDFAGTYDEVVPLRKISYAFGDRKAEVLFAPEGGKVRVTVSFDPETENPADMQKAGWQAILDNFKAEAEKLRE